MFSCSDDDESVAELSTETIEIEGGLNINFDDLTVVTIDGEAEVNEKGGFDTNTNNTIAEELPILFKKGEDIMFGYYSKTGVDNSVSIDDILLFYYSVNSELGVQGLSNLVLMSKIKSSPDYSKLKNLVVGSIRGQIHLP